MIRIVSFIICLYSFKANAQKDTSYGLLVGNGRTAFIYSDSLFEHLVYKYSDGEIVIKGDSIKAIRLLIDFIERNQKTESRLWDLIRASVDFSNTVPDIYKQSKEWHKYQAHLKKHGFITTKRKK